MACGVALAGRLAMRRRAGRDDLERDGAEGEFAQHGGLGAAGAAGLVPVRAPLDGQDDQLAARQIVLAGPAAQCLDDVGDVMGTGERLPVGLLGFLVRIGT